MIIRLAVVGCCLLVVGSVAAANDATNAINELAGTWTVEAASFNGVLTDMTGGEVIFAGETFTLKPAKGDEQLLLFKLDPFRVPAGIKLEFAKPMRKETLGQGIYKLDGDTLRVCIGSVDKRPTEFSDKGKLLIVLKRKNKP